MKKLLLFTLTLLVFTIQGQTILTYGEIYDYDIGDEFHYRNFAVPGYDLEMYTVLTKEYSPDSTIIYYTFLEEHYHEFQTGINSYDTVVSRAIGNLNNPFTDFGQGLSQWIEKEEYYGPEEDGVDSSFMYYPDTIIKYDDNLCGLEINCYFSSPPLWHYNSYARYVGKSVGLVRDYHKYSHDGHASPDYRLYYYKKGNFQCGKRVSL